MNTETNAIVFAIIAKTKHVPVETVAIDQTFEELNIDSLDAINLVFEVEEEFKISVPDDRLHSLRTIRDLVDGIDILLASRAAS
jgi:acyl carrier protein